MEDGTIANNDKPPNASANPLFLTRFEPKMPL